MSKLSIPPFFSLFVLSQQPWIGMSWLMTNHYRMPKLSSVGVRIPSKLEAGPFFGPEEEFECPDEEECEIDWDNMPGFGDFETEDEEAEPVVDSYGAQALKSLEKGKVRLEMSWQIDECKTDEDMCEDFCEDCAGAGHQRCRFCRGTGILTLGDEFRSCLICKNGREECSSCRGTGHIAPWATTMENYLDGKSI